MMPEDRECHGHARTRYFLRRGGGLRRLSAGRLGCRSLSRTGGERIVRCVRNYTDAVPSSHLLSPLTILMLTYPVHVKCCTAGSR